MVSLYQIQVAAGRHFLHEHPASALSWKDGHMMSLIQNPKIHVVTGDQCMYGALTITDGGEMLPCKKPTKWATSSIQMSLRLATRCDQSHQHQHLTGGKAAAAAYYPKGLATAILRGMRDTADAEHHDDEDDLPQDVQKPRIALACYKRCPIIQSEQHSLAKIWRKQ